MGLLHRLDKGIVAVAALVLPALSALAQARLPRGDDLLLHFYRLVALDSCIRRGLLYPRWMPDLVYGYGYPLFHFYAPLSTYLGEALHLLGLDYAMSVRLVSALALFGLGVGAYLWARDLLGSGRGGLVAAVVAVYAPFVLYTPLARGSVSDAVALAFIPFAFWSLDRIRRRPTAPRLAVAGLIVAALVLSHNVTALISWPILALYALVPAPAEGKARARLYLLGALALGLLLSAFFWYPALADRGWTRLDLFTATPEYDYRQHFLTLASLFRFPPPAVNGLMNPPSPLYVSPFVAVAGGLGLAWAWWARARYRLHLTCMWLSGLALLYLTLAPSAWLWARVPLLTVVQFPYRLLGPASVVLALPAAALLAHPWPGRTKRAWAGRLAAALFVLAIVVPSLPILYPPRQDDLPDAAGLADVTRYQLTMGALGTTSAGEYLPKTIETLPSGPGFAGMDLGSGLAAKLDRSLAPASAQVRDLSSAPLEAQWQVSSAAPFDAVVRTFYFPGWQAFIDGEAAAAGPAPESGLIQVAVPAGEHRLAVRFGGTATTRLADALSILGAALVVALLAGSLLARRAPLAAEANVRSPGSDAMLFCALGLALFVGKAAYLDRVDNPWRKEYAEWRVPGAVQPVGVDLGARLRLLACDPLPARVEAGSTIPLTLYWAALQPLDRNYRVSVQVLDDNTRKVAQEEHPHPGFYPTSWWRLGEYDRDDYVLSIDPAAPPGQYRVLVVLYYGDERLLPPPDAPGAAWGGVEIQQIQVLPPG